MTDAKYQLCSKVETLELLDSTTVGVQSAQVVCGGGAVPRDRRKRAAWFNPSYHAELFGSNFGHEAQASRVAMTASPTASEAGSVGYRLPITWGSSSKH